jgi:colanic acid/amylovoran biosynthesis glycosyltransferase
MTEKTALTLILVTYSFPFGKAEQFLENEITYSAETFQKVIVVPSHIQGEQRTLPNNVEVDTSFATSRPQGILRVMSVVFACLQSLMFYEELITHWKVLWRWKAFRKLCIHQDNAVWIARWLSAYIQTNKLNPRTTLLYTSWLVPHTTGIGLVRKRYPELKLVSRAHRDDLYEYDSNPPYIPFRKQTFQAVNRIFVISDHGHHYLTETYPAFHPIVEVARVGIKDPLYDNSPSQDGVFRIITCSFMIPVKRLHLLVDALRLLAANHPTLKIEWHHMGDGPLRTDIELAAKNLPSRVQSVFHGHMPYSQVFAFYRSQPLDVFVNISESEGIPAAIMEAYSYGIPAIATAVGGNPEIVNETNGILLDSMPSIQAIADALSQFALYPEYAIAKRETSKLMWRTLYNADVNYRSFVHRLIELYR